MIVSVGMRKLICKCFGTDSLKMLFPHEFHIGSDKTIMNFILAS